MINFNSLRQASSSLIFVSCLLFFSFHVKSQPIAACIDPSACNYLATAGMQEGIDFIVDASICIEPIFGCYECTGNGYDGTGTAALIDTDLDGICNGLEILGCDAPTACNFNPSATEDDGSCIVPTAGCIICTENGGFIFIDSDADGICNALEVEGCTNVNACNYNPLATEEDGSCSEPSTYCYQCDGNGNTVLIDSDGDGICDGEEIMGCADATACNYNPLATEPTPSCAYAELNCTVCVNGVIAMLDSDGDGICNGSEVPGCISVQACNYNVNATDDDGSCLSPTPGCTLCDGDSLTIMDADGDGICDANEVSGCLDPEACNYSVTATEMDVDLCLYAIPDCKICIDGTLVGIDSDLDGICNALDDDDDNDGCPDASDFAPLHYGQDLNGDGTSDDCAPCADSTGNNDSDGDGICDELEIIGCQNPIACNYNELATDAGSCALPVQDCTVCGSYQGLVVLVLVDDDADGICNGSEIDGCTSLEALNYNEAATDDDGSCLFECLADSATQGYEDGFANWINGNSDDFDWVRRQGATPSPYTGPWVAADGIGYIYAEASGSHYPFKTASILSPCFIISVPSIFSFDYSMRGSTMGSLEVECSINGGDFETALLLVGQQGINWKNAEIPFEDVEGSMSLQFRFKATTGISWKSDIALDRIKLHPALLGCTDLVASNFNNNATLDDGSCQYFNCNQIVPFPYCQAFETNHGWQSFSQDMEDDFDWYWHTGSTATALTGPDSAFGGSSYIYVESSSPNNPNKSGIVYAPCVELTGIEAEVMVSFAYHSWGANAGMLQLEILNDLGFWESAWTITGDQGNSWHYTQVDLSGFSFGDFIQLRFVGITANGARGDMAIDEFCVGFTN